MSETESLKPEIVYDTFAAVDLRVGRIVEVLPFPRARNPSYKVTVDFGPFGIRQSSAQITNYTPEDLVGTLVISAVNLPPRNIAGFRSEVLILGAADAEGRVILLTPRSEVAPGQPVF